MLSENLTVARGRFFRSAVVALAAVAEVVAVVVVAVAVGSSSAEELSWSQVGNGGAPFLEPFCLLPFLCLLLPLLYLPEPAGAATLVELEIERGPAITVLGLLCALLAARCSLLISLDGSSGYIKAVQGRGHLNIQCERSCHARTPARLQPPLNRPTANAKSELERSRNVPFLYILRYRARQRTELLYWQGVYYCLLYAVRCRARTPLWAKI